MHAKLQSLLAGQSQGYHGGEQRFDCPSCGYKHAFSVRRNRRGQPLLYCFNGCTQTELREALGSLTGSELPVPEPLGIEEQAAIRARKTAAANRLWSNSVPLPGTIGEVYLARRKLPQFISSEALRFNPAVSHPSGEKYPALVAQVTDMSGCMIAAHRSYLAHDGSGKAKVDPPRACLGPFWGGAIRICPFDPSLPLIVGEGIETSASAACIVEYPSWAAICAGNLQRSLALPLEVKDVIIAVDPDASGLRAAHAARTRWMKEGRRVRFARPPGADDFNDLLCSGKEEN